MRFAAGFTVTDSRLMVNDGDRTVLLGCKPANDNSATDSSAL